MKKAVVVFSPDDISTHIDRACPPLFAPVRVPLGQNIDSPGKGPSTHYLHRLRYKWTTIKGKLDDVLTGTIS